MQIWDMMRTCAIWRHGVLHRLLGEPPRMWESHMVVIRNFYGY